MFGDQIFCAENKDMLEANGLITNSKELNAATEDVEHVLDRSVEESAITDAQILSAREPW